MIRGMKPWGDLRIRWRAALSLFALVFGALGSSANCAAEDVGSPVPKGEGEDANPIVTVCPSVPPDDYAECNLPEGSSCLFELCPTRIAQCTRGRWRFGNNAPPLLVCPDAPPESESECPPCWPDSVTCPYGSLDCSAEDASINTAVASCVRGTWAVDIRPCRNGGGSNVQGDADGDDE
jgi:hypothetical protein